MVQIPNTDQMVLFGGINFESHHDKQESDNTFYLYSLASNSWSTIDFMGDYPTPRYLHSLSFFSDSHLCIFGGISTLSMIGGEEPEVFGDLFMADMNEMYMSKPFTANKRPCP